MVLSCFLLTPFYFGFFSFIFFLLLFLLPASGSIFIFCTLIALPFCCTSHFLPNFMSLIFYLPVLHFLLSLHHHFILLSPTAVYLVHHRPPFSTPSLSSPPTTPTPPSMPLFLLLSHHPNPTPGSSPSLTLTPSGSSKEVQNIIYYSTIWQVLQWPGDRCVN